MPTPRRLLSVAMSHRKTPTLIAISAYVTSGWVTGTRDPVAEPTPPPPPAPAPPGIVRASYTGAERADCFTHSGQWKPTDAWTMQLGQMKRLHRWQLTPAERSGWR